MWRIFLILLIIATGCKKDTSSECYRCTFGDIQVNGSGPVYSYPDEIHCELGAANFKKYVTIPGTVVNNWQVPTNCKSVK